jgi:hypothetical protein
MSVVVGAVSRSVSRSKDARYKSLGRCTVVEVFTAESVSEGVFFNMDSVEKSHTYWDEEYQHAQIIREAKGKTEERK